jgi:CTP:molybdopterin cytidylyltransferase MocA
MTMACRYGAILLATGQSRRMVMANKLLLVEGEPMVRRAARRILGSGVRALTVVLGHDAEAVGAVLAGLPLQMVINPDHAAGQMSSVRAGLRATPPAEGYLICLGDQPDLFAADYAWLMTAASRTPERIVVPVHRGQRGNPIVLPAAARAELDRPGLNLGCRQLIDRHPEQVVTVAATGAFIRDIDTPFDYEALQPGGRLDI